ncbi:hypothetical protein [Falsihalocynthiibacter arcticus]|uniref:Uncharacterized protein n=1 Tax=Falsihalocynthiibacter arcticus TaxID=1579316 RepID=A0A126UZA1_9RHOB|nr:hypothetical protein [Falsihalocynthiibacter arcticus]AML51402.1 hypothetical protein RC74_09175 [Falsihalocynthiibacter arcticus]
MARVPTLRVDKLLSSMGYGSRKKIAHMAKLGGITLDTAPLLDVTKRIPVTPDLPTRMTICGAALAPLAQMVMPATSKSPYTLHNCPLHQDRNLIVADLRSGLGS